MFLTAVTLKDRTLLFAAYGLCVAAAGAGAIGALLDLSWRDPTASHHVLVPLISAALIVWRRDRIFRDVETDARGALPLVLAGFALGGFGAVVQTFPISRDALSLKVAAL